MSDADRTSGQAGLRLLVVGANGRLGRHIVSEALERGAHVTAFVRSPAGLPDHPQLDIVTGRIAEEPERVIAAVKGQDVVISALGNPLWLKGLNGPAIMETATANLIAAMRAHGVRRIVLPLAWGTGASLRPAGLLVRLIAATLIRRDFRDFTAAENRLATSSLDWTIAYFGALNETAASGKARANPQLQTPSPLAVSRADLARFLVDAALAGRFIKERVVINGARKR